MALLGSFRLVFFQRDGGGQFDLILTAETLYTIAVAEKVGEEWRGNRRGDKVRQEAEEEISPAETFDTLAPAVTVSPVD